VALTVGVSIGVRMGVAVGRAGRRYRRPVQMQANDIHAVYIP